MFEVVTPVTGLSNPGLLVWSQNAFAESTPLGESQESPDVYRANPGVQYWPTNPGTYHWQVEGKQERSHLVCFEGVGCTDEPEQVRRLSPVYTVIIAPKPVPAPPAPASQPTASQPTAFQPNETITTSAAYAAVKRIIKRKTHRIAYHLRDHCARQGETQVECRAGWASAVHVTSSTLIFRGTFVVELLSQGGITYAFYGVRARYACTRHHPIKQCGSAVEW